jgi:hypothetical protein
MYQYTSGEWRGWIGRQLIGSSTPSRGVGVLMDLNALQRRFHRENAGRDLSSRTANTIAMNRFFQSDR